MANRTFNIPPRHTLGIWPIPMPWYYGISFDWFASDKWSPENILKNIQTLNFHLCTFYSGPEGARVKVSTLFFLIIYRVLNFLSGYKAETRILSLSTKAKILLHHRHRISLRLSGVGRYWSRKVGYWCFMAFLLFCFLLICPRDLHYTDTSLLSKNFVVFKLKLAEGIKLRRK